jgi:hypothetical protein
MLAWRVLAELARTHLDQVWIFYACNGIGIPALWFGIGSVIDRWRRRSAGHATAK